MLKTAESAVAVLVLARFSGVSVAAQYPGPGSFGGFRLLLGLAALAVLSGEARPTGARIARLNRDASAGLAPVQETKVVISAQRPSTYLFLNGVKAGETLRGTAGKASANIRPAQLWRQAGAQQPFR